MKDKLGLLAMMAALGSMGESGFSSNRRRKDKDIDFEKKKAPIPKGCKIFKFNDGIEIVAINEKSAYKKYFKLTNPSPIK